ncbi:MAG: carboxypeptidase-like regulatory domain-containing protein [Chitinophagaceae bacterium]|nr:carboxypeptidase-like regulatory domain-containing protein [Chitinophagaceae bacterium]
MQISTRICALLAFFLFFSTFIYAQSAKLTGKIVNEKNEPVAGASVKIVGLQGGTTSDVQGQYSLTLSTGKKYELEISAVGYETKNITEVEVLGGQVNELNIVVSVKAKDLEGIVVTARKSTAKMESVSSVIQFQKNTNTVASVISAESIRRSPDRNTGEVLKRIPGLSLQEGKFVVVRGLADRYNQAMLNGILLSSTEPDRKAFSFDMFPAQIVDNIIVNKAFVPEYPGEWAGGLIQINTRDMPAKDFFNVQVGTGFNSQTIGKDFYKVPGGSLDWLGMDYGVRGLPGTYTGKTNFDYMSPAERNEIGKALNNTWTANKMNLPLNYSFQVNGGFNKRIKGKQLGGVLGVVYNQTNRYQQLVNRVNTITGNDVSVDYSYNDDKYAQDINWGAISSLSLQLDPMNRISVKSIFNINSTNYITHRGGVNNVRLEDDGTGGQRSADIIGSELKFRQNTFFTVQAIGEHNIIKPLKLKWYGSFNILDGYTPDQKRITYTRASGTQNPYKLAIGNSLSQESGSRIFQGLNDYIYTAGGDLNYNFNLLGQKQSAKGGYMLQIKDRLYDAKPFSIYLPVDNPTLRELLPDEVFAPQNFGDGSGTSNLFAFDMIKGTNFRYLANTILNAGYLQFDNQFTSALRVVWGLRVENYDQLVGSVKQSDPRHTHSKVTDFLPGLNATLKLTDKTNLRLSGSQTVIRPELRELSFLNLYDFELNASVQGNPALKRTKVSNADLRYELYPRPGEVFSVGVFYKYFADPIEQIYNAGSGGASTFNFQNPEKAQSYGAELEIRRRLDFVGFLRNFTFQANAAYIYSRVEDKGLNLKRALQGESPYTINLGLMYDLPEPGLTATVLFNQIGERIYLVGDISAGAGAPDIYEAPRPLLDFQLSKKIIKNKAELRLNISDIINRTQYFYQNKDDKTGFQKSDDPIRFSRRWGTSFGVTFNYSL